MGNFSFVAKRGQRKFVMRMRSLVLAPRATTSCFPSRDQTYEKIRPEVKFVACFAGPPNSG